MGVPPHENFPQVLPFARNNWTQTALRSARENDTYARPPGSFTSEAYKSHWRESFELAAIIGVFLTEIGHFIRGTIGPCRRVYW